MKVYDIKFTLFITFFLLTAGFGFSQGFMHDSNFDPDSLSPVTLTGKIIADSAIMNGMYYIDVNGDNNADYILNFGPYWYAPDSSKAVRPKTGDVVTVTGGENNFMQNFLPMVVVYSINGDFWRSPFDAYWNDMGYSSMIGGYDHMGMGYSFGWMHDSLQNVTLSGTILVDSTLIYHRYYLDTNNDGSPDYFLNFGPPWLIPASSVLLPSNGNEVTLSGWEMGTDYLNMIMVYEINGQSWRDSSFISNSLGGGWIHKNMSGAQRFFNPFDSTDWMEVNPGWNGGGMMGGGNMMSDSLYCQILEVFPQNVPADSNQNTMAAFEVSTFLPNGSNSMMQSGKMGGRMNFNSNVNFQFHFNNTQAAGFNVNSGVSVKSWDSQNNKWTTVPNSKLNISDNTVTVSQSDISNFYIVTSSKVTGLKNISNNIPGNFYLKQNYPNPFNPSTTIEFSIPENSFVNLSVYNILGQKISTLLKKFMKAGGYSVNFNAASLPSGIYFYKLNVGNNSKVMKMELLK